MNQAAAISLIVFGLALWVDPLANLVSRFVQPMAATVRSPAS